MLAFCIFLLVNRIFQYKWTEIASSHWSHTLPHTQTHTSVCFCVCGNFLPDRGYQQGSRFWASELTLHLCEHAPVKKVSFACIYVNVCNVCQERTTVMIFFIISSFLFSKATFVTAFSKVFCFVLFSFYSVLSAELARLHHSQCHRVYLNRNHLTNLNKCCHC